MYCTHCFRNLFKDDPRVAQIRSKSKENLWVNKILGTIQPPDNASEWVWDKKIWVDFHGGCCESKRRIDLRLLVQHKTKGLFWLCIEIDEHQHKSYAAGYEIARYNDLFMDFSGRYVFLRVNPDPFRCGGKHTDIPFEERFEQVHKAILQFLESGPLTEEQLVEVYHYFYDS